MLLEELLKEKRPIILKGWFRSILESYPADGAKKFENVADRFNNPVGSSISQAIEIIYEELMGNMDMERLDEAMDVIIRIRSVQDFRPSQAIAFPHLLKKIIHDNLYGEIVEKKLTDNLFEFENRIDRMTMMAFDKYMQCREQIFDLKLKQKEGMFTPVERINRRRKAGGPEKDI